MITPVQKGIELSEDFQSADNVSNVIHIWWLGHSSFLVKWNGKSIIFDPFVSSSVINNIIKSGEKQWTRISDDALDPLNIFNLNYLVCTSLSPDRFDKETILKLLSKNPHMKFIIPSGILNTVKNKLNPIDPLIIPINSGTYFSHDEFEFHGIDAACPKILQDSNGNSLNIGVVVLFGKFSIFFSSDTIWHNKLVKQVRRWPITISILPINGDNQDKDKKHTLNSFQAATLSKAISSSIVMPCHIKMFKETDVSTEEFENTCEKLEQKYKILKLGQRMTVGTLVDASSGTSLPSELYNT